MAKKSVKIKTLDRTFSLAIREQYDYTCAYPDCPECGNHTKRYEGGVSCAHYYRRRYSSGRWHPNNCACLCDTIHAYLDTHKPKLVEFFKNLLGDPAHEELIERHHGNYHYSPYDRWEMNRHYRAQTKYMERLRKEGHKGILPLVPFD